VKLKTEANNSQNNFTSLIWDYETNTIVDSSLDEQMMKIFKSIGINNIHLKNSEISKDIMKTI